METRYLCTVDVPVRRRESSRAAYRAQTPCCGGRSTVFLLRVLWYLVVTMVFIQAACAAGSLQHSQEANRKFFKLGQSMGVESPIHLSVRGELSPILDVEAEPAEENYVSLEVPMDSASNSGFKAYMDFRALTSKASIQYALQQEAYTNDAGFRMYDGCYMVALGTFYAEPAGERFRIVLDSGVTFDVITGDIKSDAHTDAKRQHRNGNIVEFIVDTEVISRECRVRGDMSYAGFEGKILEIQRALERA